MVKRTALLSGACLIAVAAASAVYAGATTAGNPSHNQHHALSTRAHDSMAVFRHARSPADAMPPRVAESPILADGVGDVTASRHVGDPERGAWVMPGRDGSVCVAHDGFLNCPPADEVAEQGASIYVAARGSEVHIGGLTTDDVTTLHVVLQDGTTDDVTPTDNAFDIVVDLPPAEVSWVGPAGRVSKTFAPELFSVPAG